jgi:hypothetical protein
MGRVDSSKRDGKRLRERLRIMIVTGSVAAPRSDNPARLPRKLDSRPTHLFFTQVVSYFQNGYGSTFQTVEMWRFLGATES